MTQIPINCSGIPLHDGKVGLEQPCCCGECSCDCECVLTATLGGVTLPVGGGRFIICTSQNQAQFLNVGAGGDMALASAELAEQLCDDECGVLEVRLYVYYSQVMFNAAGDIPAVGDAYLPTEAGGVTTGSSTLQTSSIGRLYRFRSCGDDGCPSGDPEEILLNGENNDFPAKPCTEEMRGVTMTLPVFNLDCNLLP